MHDVDVVSKFNIWLHRSVCCLAVILGLKHTLIWAELEPVRIVWEVWIDKTPVDVVEVSLKKLAIVDTQVHSCGNILEVESLFIPDPKLILVSFDVLF